MKYKIQLAQMIRENDWRQNKKLRDELNMKETMK